MENPLKTFALTLAALGSLASPANADPSTEVPGVKLRNITYMGNGCPLGSVSVRLDEAQPNRMTLMLTALRADYGPDIALSQSRSSCAFQIGFHVPQGWQYSLASSNHKGYVDLQPGLKAQTSLVSYFSGSVAQLRQQSDFVGPLSRELVFDEAISVASRIWSSCASEAPIVIQNSVQIQAVNPSASVKPSGSITLDFDQDESCLVYQFEWRKCL